MMENVNELEECTFSPEISPYAKNFVRRDPMSVRSQILLEERERKLSKLARQLEESIAKEATFKPQINTHYKLKEKRDDIMKSINQQLEKRKQFMERIERLKEISNNAPHTPKITAYSQTLERDEPVYERLYKLARNTSEDSSYQDSVITAQISPTDRDEIDPATGQRLFHPVTNTYSTVAPPPRDGKVEDILYKDAENRRIRQKMLKESLILEEEIHRQSSKMNETSRRLARQKRNKDLQRAFEAADTSDLGKINFVQLGIALKHLGLFKSTNADADKRNDEEVKIQEDIWKIADPNETGWINQETFSSVMNAVLDPDSQERNLDSQSPTKVLARNIKHMMLNRLAYGSTTKLSNNIQDSDNLCFTPKINPHSRQLEAQKASTRLAWSLTSSTTTISSTFLQNRSASDNSGENSTIDQHDISTSHNIPRYEQLFRKQRETEIKIERERLQKESKELKDCTFAPQISAGSRKKMQQKEGSGQHKDRFEQLYEQRNRPRKTENQPTTLDKEFSKHCTFKPNTSRKPVPTKEPKTTPKGYAEAIERLRKAKDEREQHNKEEFHNSLRSSDVNYVKKKKKNIETEVKPFEFQLDKRKRNRPLLYIDVNLGPGRTGRIGIHEGDDPKVLAHNFAVSYSLDEVLTSRLEELLKQHMENLVPQQKATTPRPSSKRTTSSGSVMSDTNTTSSNNNNNGGNTDYVDDLGSQEGLVLRPSPRDQQLYTPQFTMHRDDAQGAYDDYDDDDADDLLLSEDEHQRRLDDSLRFLAANIERHQQQQSAILAAAATKYMSNSSINNSSNNNGENVVESPITSSMAYPINNGHAVALGNYTNFALDGNNDDDTDEDANNNEEEEEEGYDDISSAQLSSSSYGEPVVSLQQIRELRKLGKEKLQGGGDLLSPEPSREPRRQHFVPTGGNDDADNAASITTATTTDSVTASMAALSLKFASPPPPPANHNNNNNSNSVVNEIILDDADDDDENNNNNNNPLAYQ